MSFTCLEKGERSLHAKWNCRIEGNFSVEAAETWPKRSVYRVVTARKSVPKCLPSMQGYLGVTKDKDAWKNMQMLLNRGNLSLTAFKAARNHGNI